MHSEVEGLYSTKSVTEAPSVQDLRSFPRMQAFRGRVQNPGTFRPFLALISHT